MINKKWSTKEKILFLDKLATYINARIRLEEAICLCGFGCRKSISSDVSYIKEEIIKGRSLAHVLQERINYSDSILNIIKTGEESGRLFDSLLVSFSILKKQDDLKKKILSAMTYPLLIGIFALLLILGLMSGVMPEIVPMLKSMNVVLPLMTKIVIFFSDFIVAYGIIMVPILFILLFVYVFSYKRYVRFKYVNQLLLMNVPLVNIVLIKISLSLFFRTFGSMLSSDIKIKSACKTSLDSIGLLPVRKSYEIMPLLIDRGENISCLMKDNNIHIPEYVTGIIMAGEKSGTLGLSMVKISDILDLEVEYFMKRLTSIIEPVLMIFLGLFVAIVALSIVMPIYDLSKSLQH